MFQVFHLDVAKEDLRCCICCNDNICMLQAYVSSVSVVSNVCFKCFIMLLHMFAMALYACFKYFRCFRLVLQVFHLDVAKVDLVVTYVTMAIHICFKRIF